MKSEIIERLRQLHDKHGELRPVIVVEDAMQEDSPLHGEFNWNVDEAAMAHWIDRARAMIRQVRFEVVTKNIAPATVIAYVEDPDKPKGTQGYVSTIIARNDKDKAERILRVECERAEASLRRVYKVAESLNIKASRVESILAQIRDIRGGQHNQRAGHHVKRPAFGSRGTDSRGRVSNAQQEKGKAVKDGTGRETNRM